VVYEPGRLEVAGVTAQHGLKTIWRPRIDLRHRPRRHPAGYHSKLKVAEVVFFHCLSLALPKGKIWEANQKQATVNPTLFF
jgi:hypothetical protein